MKRRGARRPRERQAPAAYARAGGRRLLLDSHVWLWWVTRDEKLGRAARAAIRDALEVRISAATVWEIAIKHRLGRLKLSEGVDLADEFARDGFVSLPISAEHALAAAALPGIHRDPFGRLLVAQAGVEGLVLLTADAILARYDVRVLPA